VGLVTEERRGATALITYANPPFGTMTAAGSVETLAAMQRAVDDTSVRAVVLTGGLPGIFIRHYDVGELSAMSDALAGQAAPAAPPPPRPAGERAPEGGTFGQLVDLIAAAPKPVIAAINGLCMGGGFEISLACDIRIAGEDVTAIGLPETRVGIFPGGGGTQRLPRVIGEAKALEMVLRGITVNGPEAGRLGMVHEVARDPLVRALEIAAEFESKGVEGVAYAKRLTRAALDRPLAEGLSDERRSFGQVMRTAGAREGLRAGRPPNQIQEL
jgi:enoyl-CoA hydratase